MYVHHIIGVFKGEWYETIVSHRDNLLLPIYKPYPIQTEGAATKEE
jgi:hypothetical protein